MPKVSSNAVRLRIHERIRKHLDGSPARPRLAVFRSTKHIYAQIIDDSKGATLIAASTLDADAKMTWMVGDDIEEDIAGAQAHGMKTVLVRTGKFRPDTVERGTVRPDGIISSIAQLPDWLEENHV